MRRTFQLLFGTLFLILLGSAEAKALLSQNHAGDEWRSTPKYRVMGYAENAPGRFVFCPQLKLRLAMGCEGYGYENASGQGNYCNGDPVNGLDPDGRFGKNADDDFQAGMNYTGLGQLSANAALGEDAVGADIAYGFGSGNGSGLTFQNYDQAGIQGFTNGGLFAGTVATGGLAYGAAGSVASASWAAGGGTLSGALYYGAPIYGTAALGAGEAYLYGSNGGGASPNLFSVESQLTADETTFVGGTLPGGNGSGMAQAAPQIFYRGDQAGQTEFQSYAAQAGGIENSQAVLANGNMNDLMASHAISSEFPPSPFISVTTDPEIANTFAGPGGTVYTIQLPPGTAIQNPYNAGESEWLVPHNISPSQITGTAPYQAP